MPSRTIRAASRRPFARRKRTKPKLRKPCFMAAWWAAARSHFTANYWRFHEIDFMERSRGALSAGTGFADWPIRYADLEPYYTKAEEDLGVSGLAGASPFDPPRSSRIRCRHCPSSRRACCSSVRRASSAGSVSRSDGRSFAAVSRPQRLPALRLLRRLRLRSWAPSRARSRRVIPMAERTGRCEIRAGLLRAQDRDGPIRARDRGHVLRRPRPRTSSSVPARVIVCCNGSETPRLLLMSKSNRFPHGLANSSGLVGKYLMFDSGAFCGGLFEHPLNDFKSVQSAASSTTSTMPIRTAASRAAAASTRASTLAHRVRHGRFAAGRAAVGRRHISARCATYFTQVDVLLSHSTTLPRRIEQHLARPRSEGRVGAARDAGDVQEPSRRHADDAVSAGPADGDPGSRRRAQDMGLPGRGHAPQAVHLLGTCRMGNDPKASVVNRDHRAHDVPNLYLVDGSSFVTSGATSRHATIQALAYRAADLLVQSARRGEA